MNFRKLSMQSKILLKSKVVRKAVELPRFLSELKCKEHFNSEKNWLLWFGGMVVREN